MPRSNDFQATLRARRARKSRSAAEAIVWSLLRNSKTGFKFRREHPIGDFRLDFYCKEAMLDVELDGEQHDADRDALRDVALAAIGIETYRIPNREFFLIEGGRDKNFIDEIVKKCEERSGRKAFPNF